ncbi:MAG TPA: hypothetical protein VLR88_06955 [Propionibacteriaceae bacterium]|nr:hypothetical protein [Propionibacteriaceae bacterium]
MDDLRTIARSDVDGFDIALRLRRSPTGDVHELVVNGMFAMDSTDASSELALADLVDADAAAVLVGGLGLGFTAARLLDRTGAHLDIAELSSALIGWAQAGVTPQLGRVAADPRTTLIHADVATLLCDPASGRWDAILLDVDNGPDFLIHDLNAGLYSPSVLTAALTHLTPGGLLAVWCQGEHPALAAALRVLDPDAGLTSIRVTRDGHVIDYVIHWARRTTSTVE